MIEAGTGVRLREDERVSPEVQEARDTIFGLIPGLKEALDFLKTNRQGLEGIVTNAPELMSSGQQVWSRHGASMLGAVRTSVATELGVEKLEPTQVKLLNSNFLGWLEADKVNMDAYLNESPDAVAELFLTDLRAGFFDPIRRMAQAGTPAASHRNAGLPRPPAGGAPPAGAPKPKTEDEVHDGAWKAIQQVISGDR